MSRLGLTLRVGALLVVASAAGLVYFAYVPAGDADPHPFNHDRNAVWLEHRWLERPHPEPEMVELHEMLHRRGIAYAYPHLIPFDERGTLPPHDREQMRTFRAVARRVAPDLRVLPWVGGLRMGYKRQRAGTVNLPDLTQRQRMVAEIRGLMDEGFDNRERRTIERLVVARFGLDEDECRSLIAAAEAAVAESHQLYRFTRVVKDQFTPEERIELIEMLWEVAYADGVLHDYEASLLRRIAGLIYVSDRESGVARQKVLRRLGLTVGAAGGHASGEARRKL